MCRFIPEVCLSWPVYIAFVFIIALPIIWGFVSHAWLNKSIETFVRWNLIIGRVLIGVILFMTIASRFIMDLPEAGFDWIPFNLISKSNMTIGGWHNVINNILLMEPLGMLIVNTKILERSNWQSFWLTVLNGLIFSVFIEMVQFAFTWGAFELEDIICNVVGMAIGATSVFITKMGITENDLDEKIEKLMLL